MSLIEKLKKNSKIKTTDVLSESQFFTNMSNTPTRVPMINVALSGDLTRGISAGLGVIAGKSKHFKTSYALTIASAYLETHEDAILLFYDTEFGSPQSYFESFGIDLTRVVHTPVTNVEELKFDIVSQLEGIERGEKLIIIVDSVGNLASKKEIEDAKNEKSVADMSRAKAIKGLFRMVTPYLTMKDIPLIAINHVYSEMGLFPKDVMSGGSGIYYSANWIWFVGRRQQKHGTEVTGYDFIINIEKSRFVKEKSKIPISVSWDRGVELYSGLLEIAMAGGYVIKPSMGWYQRVDITTKSPIGGKVREAQTLEPEFWQELLEDEVFREFIRDTYTVGYRSMIDPITYIEEDEIDNS